MAYFRSNFWPKAFAFGLFLLATIFTILLIGADHAGADPGAAGDVDSSFAGFGDWVNDGRVGLRGGDFVEFAPYLDQGWVVLSYNNLGLTVRRYSYDGQFDTNFGQNGEAEIVADGNTCRARGFYECGIAVQSDGKIVVAGSTVLGNYHDFLVVRLNADGTIDSSFGNNGRRTIDFDARDDFANGVAIQDDGKIVVVGTVTDQDTLGADDKEFGTVRLTRSGDLDDTFSGNGKDTVSFGGGVGGQNLHEAYAVAMQEDGRIVVVGRADESSFTSSDFEFGIIRYDPDGTLDESFSDDGKVSTEFGSANDYATSLYIQPDGKIVIAGTKNETEFAITRYNTNGVRDDTFTDDGRVTTAVGSGRNIANAVAGQPDGKLLVLGEGQNGTVIVRYNKNGSVDNSFSGNGIHFLIGEETGNDLAVQPDGKFLFTSKSSSFASFSRIRPDQDLDEAGRNMTGFGYGNDRGRDAVYLPHGGYLVAADAVSPLVSNGTDVVLVRYDADGQLDRSYGQDGRAEFNLINDDQARDMVRLANGKVIVGGYRRVTVNDDFALWKFNADGSVDSSFGSGGYAVTGFNIGADYGQAIVVQESGKVVIAGFSENNAGRQLTMARFDAGGKLDKSFANGGKFKRDFSGSTFFALRDLIELNDGDLLAVGGRDADFWAYRFTADGQPVNSFGNKGYKEYELSGNDVAYTAAVLPNGRIAIGGYSGGDFALLLVNDNGSMCLDPCGFFGDSRIKIDFGNDESAYAMAIQGNGRIILAGARRDIAGTKAGFLAARVMFKNFPTTGYGLDPSFGTGGQIAVPFPYGASANAIILHDDKIVLSGRALNGADNDIALARLENDYNQPRPAEGAFLFLPFISR